ncbi:hypothetical protein [Vibrio furnissii]|uniref:hypothetical protein n=1 Tax=Vibrio furnissii TaxID=29494 RepID=UPI001C9BDF8B|nr:hypothetical protein [Vibrio furnissii]MBY7933104.1 hypothetical protein [Vibrio fluvialis]MCG6230238.1 hypothetical protein [Vibrio furnissii]MCG6268504.1 hypothetical protein [Vibrio furnissii]
MKTLDSDNKSDTGASLIDFALRIKEHSKESGRSNRELLEKLLYEVSEQSRTLNNMFVNTYPSDLVPLDIQDKATRKLKEMKVLSNNDTSIFLNERAAND